MSLLRRLPRLAPLLAPLLAGCIVEQTYLVEARDVRGAHRLDAKPFLRASIRAIRADDGEPVLLRARYLPPDAPGDIPDDARVTVRTRVVKTRLTVGAVLASVGAVFAASAIGILLPADREYRGCAAQDDRLCQPDLDRSRAFGAMFSLGAAGQILAGGE